ncbi:anti-sigma factor family protein [Tenggerimyces flavus]|uniref:Anti-sigma factor family protein n=1 Tax=Tenggerimyces flavus TaxID=1708749 RepID=A0ABV7YIB1_9ACTN|nr:zf-HC2 domain-containing protein [Tenggerimyces flavus]MBM7787236.1 anti-sigma factor RsiW [Tenggerimyces flavus]
MTQHDPEAIGAYVLGALDAEDVPALERHLATCPQCQGEYAAMQEGRMALHELPPEALLDGPPEGGDLLLQRTLRTVRTERGATVKRRTLAIALAAAAVVVIGVGGGAVVGRVTAPDKVITQPAPTPTPTPVPGTRQVEATDAATGASMDLTVVPAAGWVRITADVAGIPQGERCRIYVVARDGKRELVGSWLVSETGAAKGTVLSGQALIAPDQVAGVEVENYSGRKFVRANI